MSFARRWGGVDPSVTEYLGEFPRRRGEQARDGRQSRGVALTVDGVLYPNGEIEELLWIEQPEPQGIELAPLTRDTVLPLWASRRATLF